MKPYAGGKPTFEEFISPIGTFVHMFHDKPQLKTTDQAGRFPDIDPETQIQRAEYKVTLAWEKTQAAILNEMVALAHKVKAEGWPDSTRPGAFFALEPFFRDGDNPAHNTKGREYLFGKYYLNFKQKADAQRMPNGQVVYSGAPGLIGPNKELLMPTDIWPGCTGRVSGIMFASEYMGKHFISTRLNNIQKYQEGERIGGGRPDAASQFDALGPAPSTLTGLGI